MKNQSYNITTISADLRREETVKQIADSLEYLEKVSNDIFSKISCRVSEIRKKLETIDERVGVAQAKVDRLKGSNKATKVFSSYKYPGADNVDAFCATFLSSRTTNFDLEELCRSNSKLTTKHFTYNESQLQDKLKFFNVTTPAKNEKIEGEGLGRLPSNIVSISNMLLFNTSENPYKKYVMLDPLGAVTKTRKTLEEEDNEAIGAAPLSISQREQLERHNVETYSYIPDLGDVPEMDVPFALPDLPGIADDLSFGADLGPSIAPSIPGNNAIPELPSFNIEVEAPTTAPAVPKDSSMPPAPPPEAPAPPPPPPPDAPSGPTVAPPPPPPPPLPPMGPDVPQEPPSSAPANVPKDVASPADARSDLLASIRNAGGSGKAKLKSVKDRKIEAKKKKQDEKTIEKSGAGGGDLMSDLIKQLGRRRTGISGTGKPTNENENTSAPPPPSNVGSTDGSAMAKVSSMIPPPPKPSSASIDEVDEVDDDNEWDSN